MDIWHGWLIIWYTLMIISRKRHTLMIKRQWSITLGTLEGGTCYYSSCNGVRVGWISLVHVCTWEEGTEARALPKLQVQKVGAQCEMGVIGSVRPTLMALSTPTALISDHLFLLFTRMQEKKKKERVNPQYRPCQK